MNKVDAKIVGMALGAQTVADARAVQSLIAESVGFRWKRPLGDRYSNLGMLGSGGNFDLTLIEQVTNMQDAVLENLAQAEFGQRELVPYTTPAEAASNLFRDIKGDAVSRLATVRFVESNGKPSRSKRLTAVFRDRGIGMTAEAVPNSIFRLGGSNKEDAKYLQGAFGLGGALTYRNSEMVVLVTRKNPALLANDEEDRISVGVVEWEQGIKGMTALYLVDREWKKPGDVAEVWSTPSSNFPEFEYGTHLALISYRVEGVYRGFESDEKSFPSVLNTRLYRPVMPLTFTNETDRARNTTVRGLEQKLESSTLDLPTGTESLIFKYGGETFVLPVTYTLFSPANEPGNRRSLVAHDHVVLFLSNGQVHHHWTGDDFKSRTQLNKLKNRVLIVVETDDLPIEMRTQLFTPDRSSLVKADVALRLEEEVRAFIDGWEALRDENNSLIRDALNQSLGDSSAELGQRIGRAVQATGFSASGAPGGSSGGGNGAGGRSGGGGGTTKPVELHPDPTYIKGPAQIIAEKGKTLSRTFIVDAEDDFFGDRGQLEVTFEHQDLDPERDISIGQAHGGRIRVQVAIPDTAENGTYILSLKLENWFRRAGGLGQRLDFSTEVEVVDEIEGKGNGAGARSTGGAGDQGPAAGMNVALRWAGISEDGFTRKSVGSVEETPAAILAAADEQYAALAALGETLIPTITLNSEYSPFKKYLQSRSKDLETLERPRDRYAIGVGVGLLLIQVELDRQRSKGEPPTSDAMVAAAQESAARAVLTVMPAFDQIARESGIAD